MKYMSHEEIRKTWLDFFVSKNHKIVESAPLVPINDNSLLFINAGVTPLKRFFEGTEVPESKRLVSIQKCIRTNDIENVGITKRHLTYFEMMGNFSIGDYFRDEAIEYSYELLTSEEYFGIDKNLLYVTVYPEDMDSYNKWISVGLAQNHIIKLEGNFWEIGEGPCGPDSEIFFDRGDSYDSNHDAFEKFQKDEDQERYIEIWNDVFSQYNSKIGVKREAYKELPQKNIDTGAGLERWCCIFQNVDSNFETDLFIPIIKTIEELSGVLYNGQPSFKVIADHMRTITFALADGAMFDNVGRGYVLRRLLRRSVRYGKQLGFNEAFLYKLVDTTVDIMKNVYPYLLKAKSNIKILIMNEENLFLETLNAGSARLKELMKNSSDATISGEDAFKLYDTYGFPFELTLEILTENNFSVSKEEFDKYMNIQKELAKKNTKNKAQMASQKKVLLDFTKESTFVYGIYRLKSNVIGILAKDKLLKSTDHDGYIILKRTCFYATSGGQVSDTGMIIGKNFKARVLDCFKAPNGQHVHKVKLLDGVITAKEDCELIVDKERRKDIEANHSSVHLLQYALREKVSGAIKQAGSYVDNFKLRFDFTSPFKLSDDDIIKVEEYVNKLINEKLIISTEVLPLEKAKEMGAIALFSEKYSDMVRLVKMGKSMELCGGTHETNTKDIKRIAITSFESKGSNVYRIEASTKSHCEDALYEVIKPYNDEMIKLLMKAKSIIDKAKEEGFNIDFDVTINNDKPVSYKDIIFNRNELEYIKEEVKSLEKKYLDLKEEKVLNNISIYTNELKEENNIKYLIKEVNNQDLNLLKKLADNIVNNNNALVFFANVRDDNSINFICKSTSNVNAGYIVKQASIKSGGNGGGSNTFAQGGGVDASQINNIFQFIIEEIKTSA